MLLCYTSVNGGCFTPSTLTILFPRLGKNIWFKLFMLLLICNCVGGENSQFVLEIIDGRSVKGEEKR